jgi:hypothetical protein
MMCVALVSLTGCVVTPRIEISESLYFDAPMPDQVPMSYSDVMCAA